MEGRQRPTGWVRRVHTGALCCDCTTIKPCEGSAQFRYCTIALSLESNVFRDWPSSAILFAAGHGRRCQESCGLYCAEANNIEPGMLAAIFGRMMMSLVLPAGRTGKTQRSRSETLDITPLLCDRGSRWLPFVPRFLLIPAWVHLRVQSGSNKHCVGLSPVL